MTKEQTPSAEMQKLLKEMEISNFQLSLSQGRSLYEYIRTLEAENQKLREERDALQKEPEVQPEYLVEVAEYLSKGGSVIASRPLRVALGREFLRLREGYIGMRGIIRDDLSHKKSCEHDFTCNCLQKRKEQALTSFPSLQ